MSLKHILLGFLNFDDMTGYELKQLMDKSINKFWSVNLSQIYPTLNDMKEKGLLDMKVMINEGTPNSKVYHITEEGKVELGRWMEETTPLPQTRMLFLAKLLISAKFEKSLMINQLREQLALHEDMLESFEKKKLEGLPLDLPKIQNKEVQELFFQLTVDAGIKQEKAFIEWCRETIERLEQSNYEL